ncbi:hypothetical protein CANCADRAFT_106492 [Tortispora caseinolytica NRRL Y-17796]|uniref:Golgi to ER traffic protein 4 n=1 Tax=Tortispora caseinolytica NRRL Y-17796 TaxID=767744 RepID=A0A1E4TFF1_9ASCO|nr:hypothetical protein CANCADRAFT_106492 [Tortispora caseinolytica NRRL Y-17796]
MSNIERSLKRANRLIENGEYYEANQALRSVGTRLAKAGDVDAACSLMYEGAQALLKAKQGGSGTDLGKFMIELEEKSNKNMSSASRGRIVQLLSLYEPTEPTRKDLINEAISWSRKSSPLGDADLYHAIGEILLNEGNVIEAERYLLQGTKSSAEILINTLFALCDLSSNKDAAQYLLRLVVGFMSVGKVEYAKMAVDKFTSALTFPQTVETSLNGQKVVVYVDPEVELLQFVQLQVLSAPYQDPDMYKRLLTRYRQSIDAVEGLGKAVQVIGERVFKVAKPSNPLMDMMGSLFGGSSEPRSSGNQLQSASLD